MVDVVVCIGSVLLEGTVLSGAFGADSGATSGVVLGTVGAGVLSVG